MESQSYQTAPTTVAALSVAELQKIFAGAIRNWRDVGGAEKEIEVFARAAGSGTASLFDERVMAGRPYPPTAQLLPTNEAIVAEVAAAARSDRLYEPWRSS